MPKQRIDGWDHEGWPCRPEVRHHEPVQTFHGMWWLPDDEDDQQPGTLTISDHGDVTLELIGGFDLHVRTPLEGGGWEVDADDRPMTLIHGRAGNRDITIQDAWTKRSDSGPRFSDRPRFHRIVGNRAFIGVHLAPDAPNIWQGCWVHLENFGAWLGPNGVKLPRDSQASTAELIDVSDSSVQVDGWTFTAMTRHGGFDLDVRRRDVAVTGLTSARLRIEAPEPCSADALDERVKSVMDLLTLAAGTPCGVITTMLIPAPRHSSPSSSDGPQRRSPDVPVYVRHVYQPSPDAPAPTQWRFTCADKSFEDLLAAWIPVQRTAVAGTAAYFGMYYDRPGYTEARALLAAVAAEAIHHALDARPLQSELSAEDFSDRKRRAIDAMTSDQEREWINRRLQNKRTAPNFRQRMRSMLETIDAEALSAVIADPEQWLGDITGARNGLAHRADGSGARLFELAQATDATIAAYLMALVELNAECQRRSAADMRRPY